MRGSPHRLFHALVVGGSSLIAGCAVAQTDRAEPGPIDEGAYGKADGGGGREDAPSCHEGSTGESDEDTDEPGTGSTGDEPGDTEDNACVCAGEGWECSGNGAPCCWAIDPCCEPCCPDL